MKTRVLSLVLATLMIFGAISLSSCGKKSFDYSSEDLSAYITLTEKDYTNVPVTISTGISAKQAYTEISSALSALTDEQIASLAKTDAIAENDIAAIYYRGVLVDEEGKETGFEGGTNFGEEKPTWLYIGSDMFVEGFEDALIGKIASDSSITAVTEGTVGESDTIVLDIAGTYGEGKYYMGYEGLSVKLDETDVLSADIIDKIVGANIGKELIFDLTFDADGDKTDDRVVFAAKVTSKLDVKAEKISITFPTDYSNTSLAGKEAFFYVVIENVVDVDAALVDSLGYEAGEDALAALKAGAEKELVIEYIESLKGEDGKSENYADTIKAAIWDTISGADYDVVYPAGTIESYIKTEKNNLEYSYNASADAESIQSTYKTIEDYAAYVYGDEDWEAVIASDAKDFVKRKLIFYTIAKTLGVNEATKAEKNEAKVELEAAYYDYYNQMYYVYNILGGWGYTTEEIAAIAKNQAAASVASTSDTYIAEIVIKEKILDKLYEGYDASTLVTWNLAVAEDAE